MNKSDDNIKSVVAASIKRHSMEIENWQKTKLWNTLTENIQNLLTIYIDTGNGEQGILAYYESQEYWYILTTRNIIIWNNEQIYKVSLNSIECYEVGDFKGIVSKKQTEIAKLYSKDSIITEFRYETGKPSMGFIYGLNTLLRLYKTWNN